LWNKRGSLRIDFNAAISDTGEIEPKPKHIWASKFEKAQGRRERLNVRRHRFETRSRNRPQPVVYTRSDERRVLTKAADWADRVGVRAACRSSLNLFVEMCVALGAQASA
jgi:hypothetical protein